MLQNYSRVTQALLGTLFTWAITAAGSGLVFLFNSGQRKVLDGSLGFAAGGLDKPNIIDNIKSDNTRTSYRQSIQDDVLVNNTRQRHDTVIRRTATNQHMDENIEKQEISLDDDKQQKQQDSWKRIVLLIIAITVHNIPEGLAVGVAFGAIGKTASATFDNARNLAIGIGIQNFPEGLAVSLPLRASGMSLWKSFWYGQLSGMVEPLAGLIGAYAVIVAEPILPYALSFAAGAMVYVVVDDIIPEAQTCGNGKLASWSTIVGFIVMMSLDVGLG